MYRDIISKVGGEKLYESLHREASRKKLPRFQNSLNISAFQLWGIGMAVSFGWIIMENILDSFTNCYSDWD